MKLTIVDDQTKDCFDVTETDIAGYLWYKHNVFGIEEAFRLSDACKKFKKEYFGNRLDLTVEV